MSDWTLRMVGAGARQVQQYTRGSWVTWIDDAGRWLLAYERETVVAARHRRRFFKTQRGAMRAADDIDRRGLTFYVSDDEGSVRERSASTDGKAGA